MTKRQVSFARRDQVEKMNKLYRANGEAAPFRPALQLRRRWRSRGRCGNQQRRNYSGALTAFGALVAVVSFTALVSLLVWHVWACL